MYNYLKYIGLTKGVLTITDIISVSENKKRVLVRCLCSKCGHYSEVRLDRFTITAPYAEHYCKHCKDTYFLERAKSKYVGKINGVLECIDVIRLGNQIKAVCKCRNCKSITIVRPDRLFSSAIPKSCEHCIKDFAWYDAQSLMNDFTDQDDGVKPVHFHSRVVEVEKWQMKKKKKTHN